MHQLQLKTKNRLNLYCKYVKEYNFNMLDFPVPLKEITKFENGNNVSINVYGLDNMLKENGYDEESNDGVIYPLKVCKKEITNRHVNLLLTEKDGVLHYSTIIHFSRLIDAQYNKNNMKYFYCYSCLHGFKGKKNEQTIEDCILLKQHREYCKTLKPQRTIFPSDEESILKFTNIEKQLKAPFTVYCDMECALKKTSDANVRQGVINEDGKKK